MKVSLFRLTFLPPKLQTLESREHVRSAESDKQCLHVRACALKTPPAAVGLRVTVAADFQEKEARTQSPARSTVCLSQ